jgi:magnesium transporter
VTVYERHLDEPAINHARKDFAALAQNLTVDQALDVIRRQGVGERIVYFYVVDDQQRLKGVLPTRRLLSAQPNQRVSELMLPRVIAIPSSATVMEALELFVLHRFFAFPIVDEERRLVAMIDINFFTDEVFDMTESKPTESVFEAIGLHVEQLREASPWRGFRFRFPWLLVTIFIGTLCAFVVSSFEATLAKSLVLAFFLTLVLGIGESVSSQSMAVAVQALRSIEPSYDWFWRALRRELGAALLLGGGSGLVDGLIVWGWRGTALPAIAIGVSIWLVVCAGCIYGLTIPAILHSLKLDPKISAGPITLALTDLSTLAIYFTTAKLLLP